jgi:DNA-binding HxlR family transcriptional regulator
MSEPLTQSCPQNGVGNLESGLKLLADFWTLNIINSLEAGELRFCEIQRALDNLNPVTLIDRLKKLQEARLIERKEETCDKLSVSYGLTKRGVEILPVIREIRVFAEKN